MRPASELPRIKSWGKKVTMRVELPGRRRRCSICRILLESLVEARWHATHSHPGCDFAIKCGLCRLDCPSRYAFRVHQLSCTKTSTPIQNLGTPVQRVLPPHSPLLSLVRASTSRSISLRSARSSCSTRERCIWSALRAVCVCACVFVRVLALANQTTYSI